MSSSISSDIYERVQELAVAIANASHADDGVLHDSLCQTFRAYYDEQSRSGRDHPFLTEAMADFAQHPAEAVRLYELALNQSQSYAGEPTHTKMISLAERLTELGRRQEAEAYLRNGRAEAVRREDRYWIKEADRLLENLRR